MECEPGQDGPGAAGPYGALDGSLSERHELIVEDDGPGIAPEDLEHVFEPLFSTRPFGIALGLPVVRQAMEQHRGGVSIGPAAGGGTRVVLWLRDVGQVPHPSPIREGIAQGFGFTAGIHIAANTECIGKVGRFAVDSKNKRGFAKSVTDAG